MTPIPALSSWKSGSGADLSERPMKEIATWLKGRPMRGLCELMLVKEWREDVYVLICLEQHESHAEDYRGLRERGIPVTYENVVEFNASELSILALTLQETPPENRYQLRNAVLSLKRSFDGRVISADEFQRQVASVATGLLGLQSQAGSPPRTTRSPSAEPESGSSPSASRMPSRASAQPLRERLRSATASSLSEHITKAEASPKDSATAPGSAWESLQARSRSFADRLARRARESATDAGATP